MNKINIFVIDDQPIFRHGLISMLKLFPEFQISGEAANLRKGIIKLLGKRPDVVILGNPLDEDGKFAAPIIKQVCPLTRVIVFVDAYMPNPSTSDVSIADSYLSKKRVTMTEITNSILQVTRKERLAV